MRGDLVMWPPSHDFVLRVDRRSSATVCAAASANRATRHRCYASSQIDFVLASVARAEDQRGGVEVAVDVEMDVVERSATMRADCDARRFTRRNAAIQAGKAFHFALDLAGVIDDDRLLAAHDFTRVGLRRAKLCGASVDRHLDWNAFFDATARATRDVI